MKTFLFLTAFFLTISPIKAQDSIQINTTQADFKNQPFNNNKVWTSTVSTTIEKNQIVKAGFFKTFFKLPLVILSMWINLVAAIMCGFVEFIANIFTLGNYGFKDSSAMWDTTWGSLSDWWNQAEGWHLVVTIFFWGFLWLGGRSIPKS